MKTVKKIVFVFVVLAFLASCSDVPKAILDVQTVQEEFNLNAEIVCMPLEICDEACLELCGTSCCNLTNEKPAFKILGEVIDLKKTGNFELSGGQIDIFIKGTDSRLTGVFEGKVLGYTDANEFSLFAFLSPQNGWGVFNAQGGELRLYITGKRNSDASQVANMTYSVSVIGYLERVEYMDNPVILLPLQSGVDIDSSSYRAEIPID